jgi:hypothetical protein
VRCAGGAAAAGGTVSDDFYIRIDRRYQHNRAGSGARDKERELAADKGSFARLVDRLTDARTDDRSWRRGAEGEERVAAVLGRTLDASWSVIHDLTVGTRGANLDHLVIGPPGVFVLNTKNLTGHVRIYPRAILQNGRKTNFVPSVLHEARQVQDRLSAVTGRPVAAWSVLVMAGTATLEVKQRPTDFTVVSAREVGRWLQRLQHGRLCPAEVLRLERAARDEATWFPARPAARVRPSSPPPPAPSDRVTGPARPDRSSRGHDAAADPVGVSTSRWRRYGKDRIYANDGDGTRLGYIDVATGAVTLEVADPNGLVRAQLTAARRALGRRA